jgi:hypothetical protein
MSAAVAGYSKTAIVRSGAAFAWYPDGPGSDREQAAGAGMWRGEFVAPSKCRRR